MANLDKLIPLLAEEMPNLGNEAEWADFLVKFPDTADNLAYIWKDKLDA